MATAAVVVLSGPSAGLSTTAPLRGSRDNLQSFQQGDGLIGLVRHWAENPKNGRGRARLKSFTATFTGCPTPWSGIRRVAFQFSRLYSCLRNFKPGGCFDRRNRPQTGRIRHQRKSHWADAGATMASNHNTTPETVRNQERKTGGPRPGGNTNERAGGTTDFGKTISQAKPITTKAETNSGSE